MIKNLSINYERIISPIRYTYIYTLFQMLRKKIKYQVVPACLSIFIIFNLLTMKTADDSTIARENNILYKFLLI